MPHVRSRADVSRSFLRPHGRLIDGIRSSRSSWAESRAPSRCHRARPISRSRWSAPNRVGWSLRSWTDYTLGLYASSAYADAHGLPQDAEQLKGHRRIGYVEDLIFSQSLNFTGEVMRNWNAGFEISSATGQTEAVRSGAGIGILHNYIARQYPDLVRVMPATAIQRSYWTIFHESARELARIRIVADFLHEIVKEARGIW